MRSSDFARALAVRANARTEHFALHHAPHPQHGGLSTADRPSVVAGVDDCQPIAGVAVPKRHARRAVTRTLVKRQARAALARHGAALRPGVWLLRLRAPFDPKRFRSAASAELRAAVRDELETLLGALR